MKRIISLILPAIIVLTITARVNISVYADELTSGQCGENTYYEFDNSSGTLTVSGYGAIKGCSLYNGNYSSPFLNNISINKVVIEDGITNIGKCAFYGCKNLSTIEMPSSVTIIGAAAFAECSSTISVNIPSIVSWCNISHTSNDEDYCRNCFNSHYNLYINGDLLTSLEIPSEISQINNYTFDRCSSLESLTIPDYVTSINNHAFSDCTSLESVVLPSGLTVIENNVFENCESLNIIEIPSTVTRIGSNAFSGTSLCNSNFIPNSVTRIDGFAFSNCDSLESITIPDSVTSIGEAAFYDCDLLNSIKLSSNIRTIPNGCFDNCKSLKNIDIPYGVYRIGNTAFYDCKLLEGVAVPDTVLNIDYCAFSGCDSLTDIELPVNIEKISDAFSNCKNLKRICIPSCFKYDNSGFGTNIEEIIIKNNLNKVTSQIGEIIKANKKISSIVIPEGIDYIGDTAFKDCLNLTTVIIPESVSRIEYNAFSGCTNTTIKGYKNSYAETYSTLVGIPFEALDTNDPEPEHNHKYSSAITLQPTCTTTGIKTFTCSCGDSYTEIIPKKEHSYTTKTIKATVNDNGSIINSCNVCGYVQSNTTVCSPKSVTLSVMTYTFNGKEKKPSVEVTDSNGSVISSSNYSVAYTNNKNVGKATVKITFKGNYNGVISKTFTIIPKSAKITSTKAKSKGFTIKWNKITSQAEGYQIQYATNGSFKSEKSINVNNSKSTSKTVKKLKGKKKYFIRIRTYKNVNGKKYYSPWSKTKAITTKK